MSGLLGTKLGMTRVIKDDGRVIPLTLVSCPPNTIVQVKTKEKDGYPAIVLGLSALKKPRKTRKFRYLREIRIKEGEQFEAGKEQKCDTLKEGDLVTAIGISKGKGFQGVMKRHGFKGGPASHGSVFIREAGSIGMRAKPGRVLKGKRMAGHMGSERVTRKHIPIAMIDVEKNIVGIKGAIPGAKGSLIIITKE